jgi:hypothetical protein
MTKLSFYENAMRSGQTLLAYKIIGKMLRNIIAKRQHDVIETHLLTPAVR